MSGRSRVTVFEQIEAARVLFVLTNSLRCPRQRTYRTKEALVALMAPRDWPEAFPAMPAQLIETAVVSRTSERVRRHILPIIEGALSKRGPRYRCRRVRTRDLLWVHMVEQLRFRLFVPRQVHRLRTKKITK